MECSRQFGRQLATELKVPVYLYEEAQPKEYRKSLPQIRHGQYEKLPTRVGLLCDYWVQNISPIKLIKMHL